MKNKTALILGIGGTHGAVEIGVLKVLAEKNFKPDFIVGTSVGAINGAYMAQEGLNKEAVESLEKIWLTCAQHDNFFPIRKEVFFQLGKSESIYDPTNFNSLVNTSLKVNKFKKLKIKLYINCTRLKDGKNIIFSRGEIKKPVIASCSTVPFLPPVKIKNELYVDGAYSSFLGSKIARKLAYNKAIYVEPPTIKMVPEPDGIKDFMYNSMGMLYNQLSGGEIDMIKNRETTVIAPKPKRKIGSIWDFSFTKYLIKIGEKEAEKTLKDVEF
tara:strand:+ start:7698 stop:8507 length:810 start_codon:yes stop_codon:yes gene_type:complete